MAHHELTTPVTEQQVRQLRVNDTVTLHGTLFGIRDATQIHMFDKGRTTRFDLHGHAVIHTAPNVKKVEKSAEHPSGYAPVCIGTTTSDRMERFSRPLMTQNGCENCHGPGSAHVAAEEGAVKVTRAEIQKLRDAIKLPLANKVAERRCMECHDIDNSPDFHNAGAFEEYWDKVKHYGKD